MSKSSERRKAPRRPVQVMATARPAPGKPKVRIPVADLSFAGLFLRTPGGTLGQSFEVELSAKDVEGQQRSIHATCEVARETPEGVGAYFTQLDPDSALLLNLMLSV